MVVEVTNVDDIRKGNVLVDFYTSTCAPCRALHSVLEEISQEFTNLKITKIDVVQNPDMAQRFAVMSVPTVMFMQDDKVKETMMGYSNKESIKGMIKKCIGT
jgi:thioredoxin 1